MAVDDGERDPRKAIGEYQPDDWRLDPKAHATRLSPAAGPLRRALESEAVRTIMDRFEREDADAGRHQVAYKRAGRWEIHLATAAAVFGALVLFLGERGELEDWTDLLRYGLLATQVTCAAGVVAAKYWLRQSDPFTKWQQRRTAAETARIDLFETACGLRDLPIEQRQGELDPLPLQLEYFVRYQLQVQLIYYRDRGKQHEVAARRMVSRGAAFTFLAALAASLAGMSADLGDGVSVLSLAALVAPILLTAQTNLSRLDQDERNAGRYRVTLGHLEARRMELDRVRAVAARGDAAAVHDFIRAVDEVISVEHKEWITQQTAAAREDKKA